MPLSVSPTKSGYFVDYDKETIKEARKQRLQVNKESFVLITQEITTLLDGLEQMTPHLFIGSKMEPLILPYYSRSFLDNILDIYMLSILDLSRLFLTNI